MPSPPVRWLRLLVLGALVLATSVAAGLAVTPASGVTATIGILVQADPDLGEGADAQDPDAFVQDQIRLLRSADDPGLERTREQAGARLTVVQAGTSDVVLVAAHAPSADGARRSVTAAVDAYREDRLATAQRRLRADQGRVADELDNLRGQLAALGAAPQQRSGLSAEATRLLARYDDLSIARRREAGDVVPVVRRLSLQEQPGVRPAALGAAFGVCSGVCVALLLLLGDRRLAMRRRPSPQQVPVAGRGAVPAPQVPR